MNECAAGHSWRLESPLIRCEVCQHTVNLSECPYQEYKAIIARMTERTREGLRERNFLT